MEAAMRKLGVILLLLSSAFAQAASFDCTRATTPQEKAICASPKLSAADDHLALVYKAVLASMPAEVAPEARVDERNWLRQVAGDCRSPESEDQHAIDEQAMTKCMLGLYSERIEELQSRIQTVGGVAFFWRFITVIAPDGTDDVALQSPDREINRGFGTLNASWPQSRASTPEWQAWNSGITGAAQRMASAGFDSPEPEPTKWAAIGGVDADVTVGIELVSGQLVAAGIGNFWDGHGIHPNMNSIQFNWLLKEKRELRADDVFRRGSGWDQFLQRSCDKYLHQQLDHDGMSYESFELPGYMANTLHQIVIDPENWQLSSKGIAIVFQTYAVACHACTPAPVTIPWADLQSFLKATFVTPR
jgi:uncharacterized protein YecT (DUF1311 family)